MSESSYWDLHERAAEALLHGRFAEAEDAFVLNQERARAIRRPGLADRAYCNWAAVRLERNRPEGLRAGLSRILGDTSDPKARQLAAYTLANCYRTLGNSRVAAFYAGMAGRLAAEQQDGPIQASSLNLRGLLALEQSRLESARDCLRKSLEIRLKQEMSVYAVVTISTYGYCAALLEDWAASFWLLDETQAVLEELPCGFYEPSIRLTLGFTYLERGKSEEALDQGRTVLTTMEGLRAPNEDKFARYLVGEALAQQGDLDEALHHFEILQKTFFPQHPELPALLASVRTSRWLNWLGR
jgi:tetratricopeptide (TPR) repeat protein